jgi:hypothetical protein
LVRDHYRRLGFTQTGELSDGTTLWAMPADTQIEDVPMTVRRLGHAVPAV